MNLAPSDIYRSMMLEIKLRLRTVDEQLSKNNKITPPLQVEYCFLQLRKVIELISFAAIVCNHERYKDFRLLEGETSKNSSGDYSKDWNATIILKNLNNVNPTFMPRPLGLVTTSENRHHFDLSDVNATHQKLLSMYKKCNSYLHIPKPFGENYAIHIEKQREKYHSSRSTIQSYTSYLKALLWHHAVIGLEYQPQNDKLNSMEPANPKVAWIIDFGDSSDDNIHIVIGVAE